MRAMTLETRAPLDGITVLGLEQAIAAPLCTRHLADLGARVVKIEQPGTGDTSRHYDGVVRGMSAHFPWLNHGKESAALDLTDPADLAVFTGLLERADVLVSNLAPGALARLGLEPKALAQRYPRLADFRAVARSYDPTGKFWNPFLDNVFAAVS